MKLKLTRTKDYLFLVDEEAEIKEGTKWVYCNKYSPTITPALGNTNIVKEGIDKNWFAKIIAYRPLNSEALELPLPVLPPIERYRVGRKQGKVVLDGQGIEVVKFKTEEEAKNYCDFLNSKQFTLEDMKKAINMAREMGSDEDDEDGCFKNFPDQIIQSLSTKKLPKEFVPEIESELEAYYRNGVGGAKELKFTEDSNGIRTIVGTYKY